MLKIYRPNNIFKFFNDFICIITCKDTINIIITFRIFDSKFDPYLTSQKLTIMKTLKLIIVAAIFATGLFASCTPEGIQDEQTPQQIDPRTVIVPPAG